MSAAASKLEIESPTRENPVDDDMATEEKASLEVLALTSTPTSHGLVIAVDLDDVLSQTNIAVAHWHNDVYGSQMDLGSFYYYYYWKNPLWGTVKETFDKVKRFYETDRIYTAEPVAGAFEGIQTLRQMGFKLIIVTARSPDTSERSWKWVNKHFPDMFHSVVCTGQFKNNEVKHSHEVVTKLSKAQVCADLNAKILIDDSSENALQCATASSPTKVLLFGDYEWNKRISGPEDACDEMSFDRRLEIEGGRQFWKEETLSIPKGAPLWRVKDWDEVVRWIQNARKEETLV